MSGRGKRSRRHAREQKYLRFEEFGRGASPLEYMKSALREMTPDQLQELMNRHLTDQIKHDGVVIGVDLSADIDTTVIGHWENGVYVIDHSFRFPVGDPNIIEGTSVPVERRPDRLLDAGGSEP